VLDLAPDCVKLITLSLGQSLFHLPDNNIYRATFPRE
jgi:hypothetical protein